MGLHAISNTIVCLLVRCVREVRTEAPERGSELDGCALSTCVHLVVLIGTLGEGITPPAAKRVAALKLEGSGRRLARCVAVRRLVNPHGKAALE